MRDELARNMLAGHGDGWAHAMRLAGPMGAPRSA
jgi:hypothetical protein